jgi:hypothetical protein
MVCYLRVPNSHDSYNRLSTVNNLLNRQAVEFRSQSLTRTETTELYNLRISSL